MKHIEPLEIYNNHPKNNAEGMFKSLAYKINEIAKVLNSLTEKKAIVEKWDREAENLTETKQVKTDKKLPLCGNINCEYHKLPVECECEEKMVRVVYDRIKSDEVEINGDTYIRKGEPEKTAESERKYNSIWQVLNAKNDLESKYKVIEALIDGLLHSHTEQKKKELIEKIAVNEVWMKHEIFDLIKEL